MSTLKTHNLQSPDAASVNIALAPNNGMVVAGISTFNNRVLIGTNTEGHADADDLTIGSSTNTAGITIRTNTAGTGRLWFSDGTSGAAEYQGYIQYDHNNQRLSLGSGGSTRINISSTGDVGISSASPRAKLDVKDLGTSKDVILRVSADNATPYALVVGNDDHNTDANNGLAMWVGGSKTHHIQARTSETASENKLEIEAYEITLQTGSSMNRNFYFDQGGRLLIGTSTEGTGSGDNLTIADSGNMGMTLRSTDSNYCNIYFSDATSGTAEYEGYVSYSHSNNSLEFATSHTEKLRIESTGQLRHTRTDNTTRYDFEFRNTGGISDGNYGGILWTQGSSGATNLAALRIAYASTGQPDIVFATRQSGANSITDALRIHKNGDLSLPVVGSKIYTNNSGGNLTIQGGATYPGSAIKFNGGTNGGTGVMHFYSGQTTSYQERMRITAGGQVIQYEQPSFAAYRNQSEYSVNSDYIVFNTTRHNRGGHYSTSNGRFTAPVAGSYYISFWSIYKGNYTNAAVRMYVNGNRIYGGDIHWTQSLGSNWDHVSYSQVVYMNANDYIQILSASNVTWHGNHWQCFSGYLLG